MDGVLDTLRELNLLSILVRLFLAMVLGGIIGLERGRKHRAAGFRTYMLVCMGAALTMLLGQYQDLMLTTRWAEQTAALGGRSDIARYGAQVISGIGFLGAGTIIITLSKPVEKNYPAGTNVRLHTGGGEFLSCAGEALALSNDWKSFSGEITGESSGHTRKNFRKNTKFAAIMFRVYAPDRVNSKIQFRNLKLEEVK